MKLTNYYGCHYFLADLILFCYLIWFGWGKACKITQNIEIHELCKFMQIYSKSMQNNETLLVLYFLLDFDSQNIVFQAAHTSFYYKPCKRHSIS